MLAMRTCLLDLKSLHSIHDGGQQGNSGKPAPLTDTCGHPNLQAVLKNFTQPLSLTQSQAHIVV